MITSENFSIVSAEEYHKQFAEVGENASKAYGFSNEEKAAGGSILKLQQFDPNDLNLQGWMNLGFSQKQAQSILKYKEKVGYFRRLTDLQKLYVMSPQKFEQLKEYVVIKLREPVPATWSIRNDSNKHNRSFSKMKMIDINEADSLD